MPVPPLTPPPLTPTPLSSSPQSHPGTEVTVLDLFDRGASLRPLWVQVEGFRRALAPIMANAADGVHLLGYSQGARGGARLRGGGSSQVPGSGGRVWVGGGAPQTWGSMGGGDALDTWAPGLGGPVDAWAPGWG